MLWRLPALVIALMASACGASLSDLDITDVDVSAGEGPFGAYLLLAWAPLADGSCPSLASSTTASADDVRLRPELLGGKRWTTGDGMPALPYRRCIREA